MTLEQAGILVSILGTAAGWMTLMLSSRERFAKLEVKVDTLWGFHMRTGANEVITRGIGTMNSPVVIGDEAKAWLRELKFELQKFYRGLGRHNLTDSELCLEIERRFGKQLMEKVCIPHQLQQGACLLIALAVARETPSNDRPSVVKVP